MGLSFCQIQFTTEQSTRAVDETTPHLIPSTSIAPSHQDSHLQVNSQPRSDVLDQRFDQVGSSAHSLCQLNRTNVYDDEEPDYQEPSNIPVHPPSLPPSSPVQRRLLDTDDYDSPPSPAPEKHSLLYSTSAPKTVQSKTPLTSPKPFVDFKNKPKSPNNVKKWSDKPRLPKTDNVEPTLKNTPLGPQPSVARVPDLSILISELRSASPKSDPSPSPTYKSCARSESHSPSPIAHQDRSRADRLSPSQGTRSQSQSPLFQRAKFSDHNRVANQSANTFNNKDNHFLPRSPLLSRPTSNKLRCKSESPEHDYEPIENLQVEIPATPRPQTKFPHGQGKAMAEGGITPKHVKALHNFKGSNNDELCFKKGDIITVTQWLDGGWWEGTLNSRTGWFPSNYVKEVKADISFKNKSGDVPVYKRESMQLYHNVVLKNVIETEKSHVTEMIRVLQSYIKPIEGTNILTTQEYSSLVGNLEEIIAFQQSFLQALEECEKLPSSQRRIGGIFMQFATNVKELYSIYCSNHPKAVSILQKHRDDLSKLVESLGATSPGAQALITILSKPFTRLDKYPSLLKELERHVEESHPDRGDTQRAIAVYRNIANSCLEIRKLKEMEHEIITSTIQGWEGEDINKLGEVLHLSQVKMQFQTGEKYERILVLFPSCLLMLSMSERLSSYQYEGKIPLSGLTCIPLENAESLQQGFEITGLPLKNLGVTSDQNISSLSPMIEKITVICGTRFEVSGWMEVLNSMLTPGNPVTSAKPQAYQVNMISTCQPSVSTVTPAKTAQISSIHPPPPANTIPPTAVPPSSAPPQFPFATKTSCVWSLTCLRPSPPLRPTLMCREEVLKSPRTLRKNVKRKPDDPKVYNEDAFILQVIEAYCNSVKTRHTVNSSILNSPQILLAEEEKIFDETEQQERTVVDTVYALQDRVKELEQEQKKLRHELDEEKRCRKKLETLVRQQIMKSGIIDGLDGNS